MHRVLRGWNQTGVKFASLADTGDWFNRPENRTYLSILSAASLFMLFLLLELLAEVRDYFRSFLVLISMVMVYLYRVATGSVALPVVEVSK
uniref:Uncharacterized protein n=1 Tax=Ciona savignyi TaxID=51511 RepID=H2Y8Q3_CIOSA